MPLRKRTRTNQEIFPGNWLSLEENAEIEVSSEDPEWPIEGALLHETTRGWRAAHAGPQTLRIRFDKPQALSAIHLVEHYAVDLIGVTDVVLHVTPDVSGRPAVVSLAALRLR